jgi:hypothetical protein
MSRWLRRLSLALAVSLAACGDGVVIVSLNSGVIVGNPRCEGPDGQFRFRDQGGLVVLVVITSSTHIVLASGVTGSCVDLVPDIGVEVSGQQRGDRIVASSITVE